MIKSNFSSTVVLCNGIVKIWADEYAFYEMRLPTLRDRLEERDFDTFVGFCSIPLEVINMNLNANFKSRLDIWKYYKNNNEKKVMKVLLKFFGMYMIDFECVDDCLKWNKRIIPKQIFEFFCDYFAIAVGVKNIKDLDYIITDDMDEVEERRILMEQKIAKTKASGAAEAGRIPKLDIIIVGICREFGFTIEEVYNMTIYAIYYLYSQLNAIMAYGINVVAAGNGLMKKNAKITHWVDRKDR